MTSHSDLVLLLNQGTESQELNMLITIAKKRYVQEHHHRAISQMTNATGYKKDKWKTYVIVNDKRKEIIRNTEEELYASLYEHYSELEKKPKTMEDVFEKMKDYKLNALARSQKTVDEDTRRFSKISTTIRAKSLNDITDQDIRNWFVKSFLTTKPTPSSLRKQLQLFSQIFDFGIRNKYCIDNPTRYISANDYIHLCDTSQKKDEEKEFSEEEIQQIRTDCLKEAKNPHALMTLLSIETGQRAGELAALQKSDDLGEYLHVHRQQIKGKDKDGHQVFYDVGYTKDERFHPHDGRLIPITPECRKVLDMANALPGNSEYIFHNKKGKPIQRDSYIQNLGRRCKRLNIDCTHNHAFRVAFNSRLIKLGFSSADRALILGHEVQTNESHYSVTDKRHLADLHKKLTGEEAHTENKKTNTPVING